MTQFSPAPLEPQYNPPSSTASANRAIIRSATLVYEEAEARRRSTELATQRSAAQADLALSLVAGAGPAVSALVAARAETGSSGRIKWTAGEDYYILRLYCLRRGYTNSIAMRTYAELTSACLSDPDCVIMPHRFGNPKYPFNVALKVGGKQRAGMCKARAR